MPARYCMVEGCARTPVVRETYHGVGDTQPIIDEVCNGHTGRLRQRLQMTGKETLPGQVEYKLEGDRS